MSSPNTDELIKLGSEILDYLKISLKDSNTDIGESLRELNDRADEFRKNRQWHGADDLCRRSLQLACDSTWDEFKPWWNKDCAKATALMYQGTTYLSHAMLDSAITCYQQAAETFHYAIKPYSAGVAWMALGRVYALKSDWEEAVRTYQLSLDALANSTNPRILTLREQVVSQWNLKALEKLSAGPATKEPLPETMKTKSIPVVGEIAAGSRLLINDDRKADEYIEMDDQHVRGATFALRVRGKSMVKAGIMDKDYVFMKEQPSADNGDIVAVRIEDKTTLKRFFKEGNHYRLKPENDDDKIIIVVPDPAHKIAVMDYYKKKGARIEVIVDTGVVIEGKVMGVLRIMP